MEMSVSYFLLSPILSSLKSSVHGMVTHTSKMVLPTSVDPLWKHHGRYAQRCVSPAILNPSVLSMKISHQIHQWIDEKRALMIQSLPEKPVP